MEIMIATSIGELYDKISILEIKISKISEKHKKKNIENELKNLIKSANGFSIDNILYEKLKTVNIKIWNIEDDIREEERKKEFGAIFIKLARSVYISNDERSLIKREINIKYNSDIIEEKSYKKY